MFSTDDINCVAGIATDVDADAEGSNEHGSTYVSSGVHAEVVGAPFRVDGFTSAESRILPFRAELVGNGTLRGYNGGGCPFGSYTLTGAMGMGGVLEFSVMGESRSGGAWSGDVISSVGYIPEFLRFNDAGRNVAALLLSIEDSNGSSAAVYSMEVAVEGEDPGDFESNGIAAGYELIQPVSGSGASVISLIQVEFSDAQIDVNGDGRTTSGDVAMLDAIVGTASEDDPAYVPQFDFDDSGVIDQPDVDWLDMIISAGLGSGLVGDVDQDGDIDCDDYDMLPTTFSATIGDPGYLTELDADLDGDLDAYDCDVVYATVEPADWTKNGSVDYDDTLAFLTAFGNMDPEADLHPDGMFDYSDIQEWLNRVGNACM